MQRALIAACFTLLLGAPLGAEELTAEMFDATSAPKGELSDKALKAQWTAYQRAKECFAHPTYAKGTSYKLTVLSADAFKTLAPKSTFPEGAGNNLCKTVGAIWPAPKPIVAIKLNEAYGEQDAAAHSVIEWVQQVLGLQRYHPTPETAAALKEMLVAWAKAKGLSRGINVSWGDKPVDWQMMTVISSILQVYIEVQPDFTPDEIAIVGPWINGIVAKIAASRWTNRQDNKQFQAAMVTTLWGVAVGDRDAVQRGMDTYKLGIQGMRPDGSQPIDTQRGGTALQYNAFSTGNLFMIAAILKRTIGVDLLDYEVDSRSIHTGIEYVIETIKDPSLNKRYAIPCPDGGDRWGSVDKPNTNYAKFNGTLFPTSYLLVYADLFPDREASKWIKKKYFGAYFSWTFNEQFGAAPACMLGVAQN